MSISEEKGNFAGAEENLRAASRRCNFAKDVGGDIPFDTMNRHLEQLRGLTSLGADTKSKMSVELWEAKLTAGQATEVLPASTPQGAVLAEKIEETKRLAQFSSNFPEFGKLFAAIDEAKAILDRLQAAHTQTVSEIGSLTTDYEALAVQVHNQAGQL